MRDTLNKITARGSGSKAVEDEILARGWAHIENDVDNKKIIIDEWKSLESDSKREDYLFDVFSNYFNTGILNPLVDEGNKKKSNRRVIN